MKKKNSSVSKATIDPQMLLVKVRQYKMSGQFNKANELYHKAVGVGRALTDRGEIGEAIVWYRKLLQLMPQDTSVQNELGNLFMMQREFSNATECYRASLVVVPNCATTWYNLGCTLQEMENLQEAIVAYCRAIEIEPQLAEAYFNKGNALRKSDKLVEAIQSYEQAVANKVNYADAYYNLARIYDEQGNWAKAKAYYQQVIAIKPDFAAAHYYMALMLLATGDFVAGFKEYEWRLKVDSMPEVERILANVPQWQGEDFVGKRLLIIGEQEIDDCIQFIRYLPQVKELGGTVAFLAKKNVARLLMSVESIDEVIVYLSDEAVLTEFDFVVPLLSLPLIFNTTVDTIPTEIPYITADERHLAMWQDKLADSNYKIGLAWTQGLGMLASLSAIPEVTFYSLQQGEVAQETNLSPDGLNFVDVADELHNVMDIAALMANLDLVITMDTTVAHLAGALGKPVWLLLPLHADWRWLLQREDSPWYPTMRLFRQNEGENWAEVIQSVVQELKKTSS